MTSFFKKRTSVVGKPEPEQKSATDDVIFGKDKTENVVCVEVSNNDLIIFKEKNGKITTEKRPNYYWLVNSTKIDDTFTELEGDLHFKYIKTTQNFNVWLGARNKLRSSWSVWNEKEAALIYNGITYFKGMELNDVSVLSFDIESYGLLTFKKKETYMISCTLWKNGTLTRKLFSEDELGGEKEMLLKFCEWVREVDPSIITGWNIYGYDFPYIDACAKRLGIELRLGRDDSKLFVDKKDSKFRYDGANDWTYKQCKIYGREIIDCMFLAVRYDIGRKFKNWKLKVVTEQLYEEVLAKVEKGQELNEVEKRIYDCNQNRTFYDAGTIRDNWHIPEEREKIKKYGIDDGDDALNFFHLAVPAFFYLNQKVPKPFCDMINKATGSQINSLMVRAYLQEGHSLPQASPAVDYEGAISFGVPGVYKNLVHLDLLALYPSIIMEYKIEDKAKDPFSYMLKLVDYVFNERYRHKKIANSTGSKYDRDMEQSLKIMANSIYGFLGAQGLLFNSPKCAAEVTRRGRDILSQGIMWATGRDVEYWRSKL
jgi:DNA polymerase elongation subunit (family B)